ncbi:13498_t:CDS:1, partial [Ambispora leptoticha]
ITNQIVMYEISSPFKEFQPEILIGTFLDSVGRILDLYPESFGDLTTRGLAGSHVQSSGFQKLLED